MPDEPRLHRPRHPATPRLPGRPPRLVILCVEGYDLFILGAVGPSLLAHPGWEVTTSTLGLLGSLTALGMPFESIAAGWWGDLYGRRLPTAVSLAVLSLSMLLSAVAGDLTLFAATRFLTGMGTGALIPLVTAYVSEAAAPARHSLQGGAAETGIALGGIIAGVVGSTLLPSWDFHTLFHFGVVPLLFVPVGARPARRRRCRARPGRLRRAPPPAGSARCWPPGRRRTTLLFWAATFAGPVIVYGASTWLPTLMVDSGYDLSSSLEFSIALNAGAVLGTLAVAVAAVVVADRGFLKAATLTSFLCATVAMITRQHPAAPARTAARLRRRRLRRPRYPGPGQHLRRSRAPCPAARHRARLQPGVGRIGAIAGPSYLSAVAVLVAAPQAGFYAFVLPAVLGAVLTGLLRPGTRGARQARSDAPNSEVTTAS
ncbi:MFS transporter [Streptomyces sp. WAC00276]|uniref:MFS transporter n=1 Tax=Streptomyces sp. WAC00276 TaxID=2933778 RepID=UPI001FFFB52D|nr:MFS transporter [Streptomyces sp. WAC00276]MCK2143016.1 MFS transporter [Streptomyces sp. WAC00276]